MLTLLALPVTVLAIALLAVGCSDPGPDAPADRTSASRLCQVFATEIWHVELATEPGTDCAPPLPDSSYRG